MLRVCVRGIFIPGFVHPIRLMMAPRFNLYNFSLFLLSLSFFFFFWDFPKFIHGCYELKIRDLLSVSFFGDALILLLMLLFRIRKKSLWRIIYLFLKYMQKVWLDKSTAKTCMSVSSNGLTITGIDDRRYWTRIPTEESR